MGFNESYGKLSRPYWTELRKHILPLIKSHPDEEDIKRNSLINNHLKMAYEIYNRLQLGWCVCVYLCMSVCLFEPDAYIYVDSMLNLFFSSKENVAG